jgi:hypothetical protein
LGRVAAGFGAALAGAGLGAGFEAALTAGLAGAGFGKGLDVLAVLAAGAVFLTGTAIFFAATFFPGSFLAMSLICYNFSEANKMLPFLSSAVFRATHG